MFLVGLGHLIKFDSGRFDSFRANTLEALQNVFKGPLAILPFAVGLKEWLKPLLHVPLKIKSEHAQKNMTTDPVVFFVVDRSDFQGHRLEIARSEEHTSELQSQAYLVCRLLLEKKNKNI